MAKSWLNIFSKAKDNNSKSIDSAVASEQETLNDIGKLLWAIFPEEAEYIIFEGQLYPQDWSSRITFEREDGSIYWNDEGPSHNYIDGIFELLKKLRNTKMFSKDEFTQVNIRLSSEKKIETKFAYISEGNRWPGLYMRGVSDLTEEEIKKFYVPNKDWEERLAKFGTSDIG